MDLVSNELTVSWPASYDNIHANPSLGYEKIEGTHYNKYEAFLTSAYIAKFLI